jgi:hypothetical protein
VAAIACYEHAYALVRAHGEAGWIAHLVPLTVDGLMYASSILAGGMAMAWPTPAGAGDRRLRSGKLECWHDTVLDVAG